MAAEFLKLRGEFVPLLLLLSVGSFLLSVQGYIALKYWPVRALRWYRGVRVVGTGICLAGAMGFWSGGKVSGRLLIAGLLLWIIAPFFASTKLSPADQERYEAVHKQWESSMLRNWTWF